MEESRNIKRRKFASKNKESAVLVTTDVQKEEKKPAINIERLEPGMVIKNYKELCELTDQPVLNGNAKKSQMKEFKRYFDFEKSGQKMCITEVYSEPLPIELGNRSNKYVRFIENILLSYLSEQKECVTYLSRQQLWLILGLVNSKYFPLQKKKELLLNLDPGMTMFEIEDFYKRCNQKIYSVVDDSLNSLQRRYLLDYSKSYRIGVINHHGKGVETIEYRNATNNEISYILGVKRKVLTELGYEFDIQVYLHNEGGKFWSKVKRIYKEEKGWDFVFEQYKMIYNQNCILKEISIEKELQGLNSILLETLRKQSEDKYKKTNNIRIGKGLSDVFQYPLDHLEMQELLSNHLIRIKGSGTVTVNMSTGEITEEIDEESEY